MLTRRRPEGEARWSGCAVASLRAGSSAFAIAQPGEIQSHLFRGWIEQVVHVHASTSAKTVSDVEAGMFNVRETLCAIEMHHSTASHSGGQDRLAANRAGARFPFFQLFLSFGGTHHCSAYVRSAPGRCAPTMFAALEQADDHINPRCSSDGIAGAFEELPGDKGQIHCSVARRST